MVKEQIGEDSAPRTISSFCQPTHDLLFEALQLPPESSQPLGDLRGRSRASIQQAHAGRPYSRQSRCDPQREISVTGAKVEDWPGVASTVCRTERAQDVRRTAHEAIESAEIAPGPNGSRVIRLQAIQNLG